jgi:E3 ubiquitin-protein ligase RGLG
LIKINLGIDFTISNLENGGKTFNGRSLHYYDENIKNPYQKVIEILGKTLECFDIDGKIPAFGFGDSVTKDRKVFPFVVRLSVKIIGNSLKLFSIK